MEFIIIIKVNMLRTLMIAIYFCYQSNLYATGSTIAIPAGLRIYFYMPCLKIKISTKLKFVFVTLILHKNDLNFFLQQSLVYNIHQKQIININGYMPRWAFRQKWPPVLIWAVSHQVIKLWSVWPETER